MKKRTKKNVSAVVGISAVTALSGILFWNYYLRERDVPRDRDDNVVVSRVESPIDNLTEANRLLTNFPSKITGARSVDKYLTPKARYCLVHIKSAHVASYKDAYSPANCKMQKDLYSILSDLVERRGLDEVYAEGIIPSSVDLVNFDNPAYSSGRLAKTSSERVVQSGFKAIAGALSDLVNEGKLKILAAEMEETYMRAIETGGHTHLVSSALIVRDDREDAFLSIISRQQKPLIVTVYGAGHSWGGKDSFGDRYLSNQRYKRNLRDNIDLWNKTRPQQKFSLIEIIPDSLKESLSEKGSLDW